MNVQAFGVLVTVHNVSVFRFFWGGLEAQKCMVPFQSLGLSLYGIVLSFHLSYDWHDCWA
jgi:hypothetical protein